jgi:3-hydroxybutyryl-CoA dehydrogenase
MSQDMPLRIGVIGAGVMGSAIAQTTANSGYPTHCYDIAPDALAKGREAVTDGRYGVHRGVARGKLSPEEAEATLERLAFTSDLEEVAQVDLVIECVPESLDLKIRTFRELDRLAPPGTILASNTSGFSIAALAAATDRPSHVIGWHWASPAVVMRMAEIVTTEQTDSQVIQTVCAAADHCGKNPVVVRDNPMVWGFVANRVYGAMLREAQRVVDEGIADPSDINQIMVDCFNWPVGPFAMVQGATQGWGKD